MSVEPYAEEAEEEAEEEAGEEEALALTEMPSLGVGVRGTSPRLRRQQRWWQVGLQGQLGGALGGRDPGRLMAAAAAGPARGGGLEGGVVGLGGLFRNNLGNNRQ